MLLLWLQVASANAAACSLDKQLEHLVDPASHVIPNHTAGQSQNVVTTSADCGEPQLLLVECIVPIPMHAPSVTVVPARVPAFHPARVASPTPRLDPPPPRA